MDKKFIIFSVIVGLLGLGIIYVLGTGGGLPSSSSTEPAAPAAQQPTQAPPTGNPPGEGKFF